MYQVKTKPTKIEMTHARLIEWGEWVRKCLENGLGYPSQSTMVTALQGSRSTAPHYPRDNSYAEEVNRIIYDPENGLVNFYESWGNIIKAEYVDEGTVDQKRTRLGYSRDAYYNMLNQARAFVMARLTV